MKDRTPHLCRNAFGTAICGRWWKASAVSTHLTIWTEMPDWVIRMLWHNIWESTENHPTQERGNHE